MVTPVVTPSVMDELQPRVSVASGFRGLGQLTGQKIQESQQERKAQEDIATAEELFNDEQTFMDIVNDDKFMALAQRNPQLAKVGMEIAMTRDNQIMQAAQREINNDAAFAVSLLDLDNAGRKTALIQKAKQWMVESQDASPERRDTLMAKAEEAARLSTLDAPSLQAELTEDALLSDLYTDFMKGRMGRAEPAGFSAKTQIYNNGTIVQTDNRGNRVVRNPSGEIVQGESAKKVINAAIESGVSETGARSGARTSASESSKAASEAYKQLSKIRKNIRNLNQGVRLIDEGAKTGRVESLFPSFKSASIQLDQLQNELGLDVIGNTTFGALSEGELELALDTALPTGLDEQELRDWLIDKRDAQQKLSRYIEDAAIFLDEPGNTIGDWLRINRDKVDSSANQGGEIAEGTIIKNPETGERLQMVGGKWQRI